MDEVKAKTAVAVATAYIELGKLFGAEKAPQIAAQKVWELTGVDCSCFFGEQLDRNYWHENFPKVPSPPTTTEHQEIEFSTQPEEIEGGHSATEIAEKMGMSAAKLNLTLARAGMLQKKNGEWDLTEAGRTFGQIGFDSRGRPNRIRWSLEIIEVVESFLRNEKMLEEEYKAIEDQVNG